MQTISSRLGVGLSVTAWPRTLLHRTCLPLRSLVSTHVLASMQHHYGREEEKTPYKAFLLDMDGVLQNSGTPVKGAGEFVNHLQLKRIPYILLTNECRYTNIELQKKLVDVGIEIPVEKMYTASNATRDYFKDIIKKGWSGNIFYIGEEGLADNLLQAVKGTTCKVYGDLHCEAEGISYVVVGAVHTGNDRDDSRFHERACEFVAQGARLVYTCPDYFAKSDGLYKFGYPMPVVQLIEHVTGCGSYNLGKPNPFMLRMAHHQLVRGLLAELSQYEQAFVKHASTVAFQKTLFIGDSLGTDIRTAIDNGIDAALVLSGTTSHSDLEGSALQPNYVFDDISTLHKALEDGQLLKIVRN